MDQTTGGATTTGSPTSALSHQRVSLSQMMFCNGGRGLLARVLINPTTWGTCALRKSLSRLSACLQSSFLSTHHTKSTNHQSSRGVSVSTNVGTPSQAQIVIAGGGVIGCSVAYHLAKLGWKDIILLEQGSVSGGTTWHSAGLLAKMRATNTETCISNYAAKLYRKLEEETGLQSGFKRCGALLLARTNDRVTSIKRMAVHARSYGIETEMISAKEAQEMWPLMRVDDLKGVLWLPDEGVISPSDLCSMLARGATNQGVRVHEKVQVKEVLTDGKTVKGVLTNQGKIDCEIFVNCCGLWARELGLNSNPVVNIPLHAVEHFYILSKSLDVDHMLPALRDPDGGVYFREWSGGLCAGGTEPHAKPCFHEKTPENFEFQLLPENWDQFEVIMDEILHRVPVLEKTEILQMINGPESFTPDGKSILGEAPTVRNYFVSAGLAGVGISNAAGIGDLLSHWITHGHPPLDVTPLDIKRFTSHHNNKRYLHDRVQGVVGLFYALPYPRKEVTFCRKMKCSALYTVLDSAGACWGDRMGWETPNWFALTPDDCRTNQGTFGKPHWFKNVEEECKASRNAVAVVDLTSSGLFEVKSKNESDSLDLLQSLCISDMDIPIGHVVHTSMLNENAGYELQCTIIRRKVNRFVIVTKPTLTTRAESWISRNKALTSDVTITNIQSTCSILGILGPKSRDLLQQLTLTALGEGDFPVDSSQVLELDYASDVMVVNTRNIYGAGTGWLLLVPNDQVVNLYSRLMCTGEEHGVRNMGWYALNNTRIEKGFPMIGEELVPSITPYDVGLDSTIDFDKEFVGKSALSHLKVKSSNKKLVHVMMTQHDDDCIPWGGETVVHNGDVIGEVTSSAFDFNRGHPVCLGFVKNKEGTFEGNLEINIAGKMYPVQVVNTKRLL